MVVHLLAHGAQHGACRQCARARRGTPTTRRGTARPYDRRMSNEPTAPDIPRPDGLVLAPFRALRFDPAKVRLEQVLAPPYDVIEDAARDGLEARDPHNVVRLTLPKDGDGRSGYEAAASTLAEWRSAGVLAADSEP